MFLMPILMSANCCGVCLCTIRVAAFSLAHAAHQTRIINNAADIFDDLVWFSFQAHEHLTKRSKVF